ncbi:LOW QUALITY PROTEIN: hypothetical protein KUTeg_008596 [Tegillarca granosa]|uniref:Uncharacterized protein n=1 Tax=Tegillarca granosa TaxID=220873 RepID=A0ABQ9FCN3_TEGGR|nr:LOW QUALITY PROTEIN: hypothetical protein KUTeg_008596 [Tegillarca granosa]
MPRKRKKKRSGSPQLTVHSYFTRKSIVCLPLSSNMVAPTATNSDTNISGEVCTDTSKNSESSSQIVTTNDAEILKSDSNSVEKFRSRRYNLLLNGIPETKTDNTEDVFCKFVVSNLKIKEDTVDDILISNCHGILRNPENMYKVKAQNAILVKFVCFDRNLVLKHSKNLMKQSHMIVRTHLSNELKVKRASLSRKAYKLRRENNLKTRLRENNKEVCIEIRNDNTQPWSKLTRQKN